MDTKKAQQREKSRGTRGDKDEGEGEGKGKGKGEGKGGRRECSLLYLVGVFLGPPSMTHSVPERKEGGGASFVHGMPATGSGGGGKQYHESFSHPAEAVR